MLQIYETKLYSLNLGIYEKFIAQIVLFIRTHYQLNNAPFESFITLSIEKTTEFVFFY